MHEVTNHTKAGTSLICPKGLFLNLRSENIKPNKTSNRLLNGFSLDNAMSCVHRSKKFRSWSFLLLCVLCSLAGCQFVFVAHGILFNFELSWKEKKVKFVNASVSNLDSYFALFALQAL